MMFADGIAGVLKRPVILLEKKENKDGTRIAKSQWATAVGLA